MSTSIEANSLSDITQIAGNPPKYPRNPTEAKRPPLTLYIAHLILTTLKPQLKNVTAEDVASSLYYLHLKTEDDARFLDDDAGAVAEEPASPATKPLPRKPLVDSTRSSVEISRKPLPESARSSIELSRQPTSMSQRSLIQDATSLPKRKPVGSKSPTRKPLPQHVQENGDSPRRPLGPRPIQSDHSARRKHLPGAENRPLSLMPGPQDNNRLSRMSTHTSMVGELDAGSSEAVESSSDSFSFTLIRRDPASGAQWNIGSVTGAPSSDEAQSRRVKLAPRLKKPYFDLSVHLTTPGYSYFRGTQTDVHAGDATAGHGMTSPDSGRFHVPTDSTPGFDRYIRMEGTHFWNRSSPQRKRALSDISVSQATTTTTAAAADAAATTTTAHGRRSSGTLPGGVANILAHLEDSHAKGYVFLSPWGGRCKFSTGAGGRSLRCIHSLPAPVSAKNTAEPSSSAHPPAIVSQLRFNLPSPAIFIHASLRNDGAEAGRFHVPHVPKLSEIRNRLSRHRMSSPPHPPRPLSSSYATLYPGDSEHAPQLPPRPHSPASSRDSTDDDTQPPSSGRRHRLPFHAKPASDGDEQDDSRLDLRLGQEKAGGGNRGKRAKLGKLIIHDEGLKMLDLVVASNMGVWWSIWESQAPVEHEGGR